MKQSVLHKIVFTSIFFVKYRKAWLKKCKTFNKTQFENNTNMFTYDDFEVTTSSPFLPTYVWYLPPVLSVTSILPLL